MLKEEWLDTVHQHKKHKTEGTQKSTWMKQRLQQTEQNPSQSLHAQAPPKWMTVFAISFYSF